MLNLFKPKKISKIDFINQFINHPNHEWLKNNERILRAVKILLETFTDEHIQFFNKHKTYLIPCDALLSCAIGKTKNDHLILIFPELVADLKSVRFDYGVAVLAHEFGHVFYQHTEKKVNSLKAQIEADQFAFELGFGEELQEVLLNHQYNEDCRVRVAYLTSRLVEKFSR